MYVYIPSDAPQNLHRTAEREFSENLSAHEFQYCLNILKFYFMFKVRTLLKWDLLESEINNIFLFIFKR